MGDRQFDRNGSHNAMKLPHGHKLFDSQPVNHLELIGQDQADVEAPPKQAESGPRAAGKRYNRVRVELALDSSALCSSQTGADDRWQSEYRQST